ncbi:Uma2 family endonuclease [Oscillatoria sp. FACHB-1406]|uniref:Uma2 family endonuclease n=1 Tax=Oscillatoria sp. FACHB-1406 TaxID=2692846 RepID=UPI001687D8C6|nr:Uma2 family endonuclease [Oscillatoria sp. FACHB-1406]MBD2579973.1 Uma2 family endonuclease [Oscillatoria sp. FACHB-1406]
MIAIAAKPLTLAEFLQLPETKPASEFIAGEIIQKPMPKGRHSCLQYETCHAINQVAKPDKIAYAFPELRCTFGDRSLVPDLAVFRWQNIPFLPDGEVPDRFELPPDWIIEILSPDQKINKVIGKILYCIENGSELGWFLDPDDASVLVFGRDRQPIVCENKETLPVLEGIELKLTPEQVFSWLKMQ